MNTFVFEDPSVLDDPLDVVDEVGTSSPRREEKEDLEFARRQI
jgi:hypothetical protein